MTSRHRQEAIVRSLRREGTMSIDALAQGVGASRRTVLRDISALRDQGFVLHSECGRGGGVPLDPQSVQTTARLSVAEVFALLISVAAMRAAQNSQVRQLRVDFWGLALSGANKINGLMVPSCLNPRSTVVARHSKNTFDMKVP